MLFGWTDEFIRSHFYRKIQLMLKHSLFRTIKGIFFPAAVRKLARIGLRVRLGPAILLTSTIYILSLSVVNLTNAGRILPMTWVAGIDVGEISPKQAHQLLTDNFSSLSVTLTHGEGRITAQAEQLGLAIDQPALAQILLEKRPLQALLPHIVSDENTIPILRKTVDLDSLIKPIASEFERLPTNAKLKFEGASFVLTPAAVGSKIDHDDLVNDVARLLSHNARDMSYEIQPQAMQPEVTDEMVDLILGEANKRLDAEYLLEAGEKQLVISRKQIASWLSTELVDEKLILSVDDDKAKTDILGNLERIKTQPRAQVINLYLSGKKSDISTTGKDGIDISISEAEMTNLVDAIVKGVSYTPSLESTTVKFTSVEQQIDDLPKISATYTYDVSVWGTVVTDQTSFMTQAQQTLSSSLGWLAAGVSFQRVASGGDFTLVLASPARVAAASPGCSSQYSCRVGRYVIINDDRWQGATTSWNNGGGSLRDYRHMVVNHEVGHWLGFGHRSCPAAGELAPVMQQQSISLGSCKFNPWPTPAEISSL